MEVSRRVVTLRRMMLELVLGRGGGDKAMGAEAHRAKGGIILKRSHVDVGVVAQDVAGHNIARSVKIQSEKEPGSSLVRG